MIFWNQTIINIDQFTFNVLYIELWLQGYAIKPFLLHPGWNDQHVGTDTFGCYKVHVPHDRLSHMKDKLTDLLWVDELQELSSCPVKN